jgi:hypothetical protein
MSDTARLRLLRQDLHHLLWAVSFLNDELDDEFTSTIDLVLILEHIDEIKSEAEQVQDSIRQLKAGLL